MCFCFLLHFEVACFITSGKRWKLQSEISLPFSPYMPDSDDEHFTDFFQIVKIRLFTIKKFTVAADWVDFEERETRRKNYGKYNHNLV